MQSQSITDVVSGRCRTEHRSILPVLTRGGCCGSDASMITTDLYAIDEVAETGG